MRKLSVLGQPFNPPESKNLSSSQLLTNHVLNPIRGPKTHSKAFQSSKDLSAHYGIPEIPPPASRNPSDNTNTNMDPVAPPPTSDIPEELSAPVIPDIDIDVTMLGTESSLDFSIKTEPLAVPQPDAMEMVTHPPWMSPPTYQSHSSIMTSFSIVSQRIIFFP